MMFYYPMCAFRSSCLFFLCPIHRERHDTTRHDTKRGGGQTHTHTHARTRTHPPTHTKGVEVCGRVQTPDHVGRRGLDLADDDERCHVRVRSICGRARRARPAPVGNGGDLHGLECGWVQRPQPRAPHRELQHAPDVAHHPRALRGLFPLRTGRGFSGEDHHRSSAGRNDDHDTYYI
jgi:hypothetical protein